MKSMESSVGLAALKAIAVFWLACVAASSAQAADVSKLADALSGSPPGTWTVHKDNDQPGGWSSVTGVWEYVPLKGYASGVLSGGAEVTIFPDVFKDPVGSVGTNCSPPFLAETLMVLSHELLHFVCPVHSEKPGGGIAPPGSAEPTQQPTPPDCNDLNYAMNTAASVCSHAQMVADCLSDYPDSLDDPIPEACLDILPEEYRPDPSDTLAQRSTKKSFLIELLGDLKDEHAGMQNRWNSGQNAQTAFDCACGGGGGCPVGAHWLHQSGPWRRRLS